MIIRRTWPNRELDRLFDLANLNHQRTSFGALTFGNIGDGTTAGRLRTNAAITYAIAGQVYTKSSTDNLWNLSALTNTGAAEFQAHALCLNSSGTASLVNSGVAASAAAAMAALKALLPTDKAVVGVFVAGNSTDYDNAGGLAAQGTIYNGIPDGVFLTSTFTPGLLTVVNA